MHVKKENKNVCRYEQSIVVMAAIGAWREKYNQKIWMHHTHCTCLNAGIPIESLHLIERVQTNLTNVIHNKMYEQNFFDRIFTKSRHLQFYYSILSNICTNNYFCKQRIIRNRKIFRFFNEKKKQMHFLNIKNCAAVYIEESTLKWHFIYGKTK